MFSVNGLAHTLRCGRSPFIAAHHAAGTDVSWSDLNQRMVKQVKSAGQGVAAAAAAAYVRGGLTVCPDGALTPDVRARMMSSISAAAGCAPDALSWSEGVDLGSGRSGGGVGHLQRRSASLFTPHPRANVVLRQAAQRVLQLVEVGAYVHWCRRPLLLLPAPLCSLCRAGTSNGAASAMRSLLLLKLSWNRVHQRADRSCGIGCSCKHWPNTEQAAPCAGENACAAC